MYGSELEGDEEELEEELRSREGIQETRDSTQSYGDEPPASTSAPVSRATNAESESKSSPLQTKPAEEAHRDSSNTTAKEAQTLGDEGGELVPRAAHDATSASK